VIITVTMNAALDRTLTVPNFQRGQRHRASEKLTLAGGKGIIVARALKGLGVPVVATGLAGGRNGRRILEELAEEAILNDFVRIDDESRTSTAVSDPTSGTVTEVIEWGPLVHAAELEVLLEKLDYLARGAEMVVFAGSLPRGVEDDFYAEAIRTLNRRGVLTVLDSEGEPLRLGLEAEPFLVSPNRLEAEAVVGQEFSDDGDFLDGLDSLEGIGARNTLITFERGCFASVHEERGSAKRFRAEAPHLEAVSRIGSGAVLLAGFISAWLEDSTPEDALRKAVAAGAASTLEVGAGRFDPRDVGRILPDVRVAELSPVVST
jgi:1-phosphofructokinase family hexose kinase